MARGVVLKSIAFYEARITFGFASLLPLLLLPGYVVLGGLIWLSRDSVPSVGEFARVFELLLTLTGGLASAHLMTIEREEGFDEIRRTYPERGWRLPIMRMGGAAVFLAASGAIAAGLFLLLHGSYDAVDALLPAFVPALYLASLSILVNNVTGSYWVAAGVTAGYWFGDYLSGGSYTQLFYLFNHTSPLPGIDPAANRAALLILAVLLVAVNVGFSLWRRRGAVG